MDFLPPEGRVGLLVIISLERRENSASFDLNCEKNSLDPAPIGCQFQKNVRKKIHQS